LKRRDNSSNVVTKGIWLGLGFALMAVAIALPFIIFNMPSDSMADAFGSVIVGLVIMFGLSPLLFVAGLVLVIVGFVKKA
jgi:hypothetical protein